MAVEDRIFISPKGTDNQGRLSAIQTSELVDAINTLEEVLKAGERSGVGFTQATYLQVLGRLTTALRANQALTDSLELIKSEEDYAKASDTIKDRFRKMREWRENGQW